MKKLLLVSSDTIHTYKYAELISGFFDKTLLLTPKKNPQYSIETKVLNFSLRSASAQLNTPRHIRNICKEFAPDIVHIHQASSGAYYTLRALKGSGIPVIVSAWGSDILYSPKKSLILKKMVKYILQNADGFTSDSRYMAEEMDRLAGKKLDTLIANFSIDAEPMDLPKENIIYSNRLHKKLYRVDKVILAFEKFSKTQNEKWKLVIAATGEETESLKKLASSTAVSQNIEFAGWVDKKKNSEFYSKARIFVSIPESDATSISLLEAMACGCLPVVSDLPANREWIVQGENGLIVNDTDTNFFEDAIRLNAEKAIGKNKKIAEEHGTKAANREKFISLYKRLLARK